MRLSRAAEAKAATMWGRSWHSRCGSRQVPVGLEWPLLAPSGLDKCSARVERRRSAGRIPAGSSWRRSEWPISHDRHSMLHVRRPPSRFHDRFCPASSMFAPHGAHASRERRLRGVWVEPEHKREGSKHMRCVSSLWVAAIAAAGSRLPESLCEGWALAPPLAWRCSGPRSKRAAPPVGVSELTVACA